MVGLLVIDGTILLIAWLALRFTPSRGVSANRARIDAPSTRPARLVERLVAGGIDAACMFLIWMHVSWLALPVESYCDDASASCGPFMANLYDATTLAAFAIVPVGYLTLSNSVGAALGKRLFQLVVVTSNPTTQTSYQRPTLARSVWRALVTIAGFGTFGTLGYILVLRKEGRALTDRLSGTAVLRVLPPLDPSIPTSARIG
jgi:uncharacterized RDD family membrane protein YckC